MSPAELAGSGGATDAAAAPPAPAPAPAAPELASAEGTAVAAPALPPPPTGDSGRVAPPVAGDAPPPAPAPAPPAGKRPPGPPPTKKGGGGAGGAAPPPLGSGLPPVLPLPDPGLGPTELAAAAQLDAILDAAAAADTDGFFARPVRVEECPNYYTIVARPMSFAMIKAKVRGEEGGASVC